jgi:hypothetical protein
VILYVILRIWGRPVDERGMSEPAPEPRGLPV